MSYLDTNNQAYINMPNKLKKKLGIISANEILENETEYINKTIYYINTEIILYSEEDLIPIEIWSVQGNVATIGPSRIKLSCNGNGGKYVTCIFPDDVTDQGFKDVALLFTNEDTANDLAEYIQSRVEHFVYPDPDSDSCSPTYSEIDAVIGKWVKRVCGTKD